MRGTVCRRWPISRNFESHGDRYLSECAARQALGASGNRKHQGEACGQSNGRSTLAEPIVAASGGDGPRVLVWSSCSGSCSSDAGYAFATLQLVHARQEALTGIDGLETLRASMTVESVNRGDDLAGLERANAHFQAAHERSQSVALFPLRVVPVVGRQIRSIDALTRAATDVTSIAEARLDQARELLSNAHVGPSEGASSSSATWSGWLGTHEPISTPCISALRTDWSVHSRARDRFVVELGSLRTSSDHIGATSAAVGQLLQGPRRYLLLAANNSEMRVGSGAFLSVGVLSTADGSLDLGPMESIVDYNLPDDRVPLSGDLASALGLAGTEPGVAQPRVLTALRRERRTRREDVEGIDGPGRRRCHGDRRRRTAGFARGDRPGASRWRHRQLRQRGRRRDAAAVRPRRARERRSSASRAAEHRGVGGGGPVAERLMGPRASGVGARRSTRRAGT